MKRKMVMIGILIAIIIAGIGCIGEKTENVSDGTDEVGVETTETEKIEKEKTGIVESIKELMPTKIAKTERLEPSELYEYLYNPNPKLGVLYEYSVEREPFGFIFLRVGESSSFVFNGRKYIVKEIKKGQINSVLDESGETAKNIRSSAVASMSSDKNIIILSIRYQKEYLEDGESLSTAKTEKIEESQMYGYLYNPDPKLGIFYELVDSNGDFAGGFIFLKIGETHPFVFNGKKYTAELRENEWYTSVRLYDESGRRMVKNTKENIEAYEKVHALESRSSNKDIKVLYIED